MLSSTIFGIVTTAKKGPTDSVTLITSEGQLFDVFGPPSPDHYGIYAAQQFLKEGNRLLVVRVAGYSEATAQVEVQDENESELAVTFRASSSGSWANGATTGVQVQIDEGTRSNSYKITIKYRGYVVERYDSVVLTPTDSIDYIGTRLADSKYVEVEHVTSVTTMKLGTYTLTGGDDGASVTESDVVGTIAGGVKTGLKLFSNPEEVDVNLIAVPGDTRDGVISELISIAEVRQDCLALIDPPSGLDVQEVVDWHNGLGTNANDPKAPLSTSYASLSWPWIQVYDSWNDVDVWVPPSAFVSRHMALTDRDYEIWYAPAGLRRGRLADVLDVEYSPTLGEREYLYGGRAGEWGVNAINPFVKFQGLGIVRWGQRTLQRYPTALDRENVRRLLLYMRKIIATAVMYLVFEPNDPVMWSQFRSLVTPVLESIKSRRGIVDYQVVMDESTNTPEVRDRNEAVGLIYIRPTKAAEVIQIKFVIMPQGVTFQEVVTQGA